MVRMTRHVTWQFPNYFARFPDCYYRFRLELNKSSARVHDRALPAQFLDYVKNPETGQVERVRDVPIPVLYPKEADNGIWGGEGIVKGYVKLRKYFQAGKPKTRIWFPNLCRAVFYSEILDKYLKIVCTRRTLNLVDDAYGFDNYILRTPVQDLKSQLALHLRHLMLLKLARNDFDDPNHGKEMIEKHNDCIIPVEEAEWYGLSLQEAMKKQKHIDSINNVPIPLKVKFGEELLNELKKMKESGEFDSIAEQKTGLIHNLRNKLKIF